MTTPTLDRPRLDSSAQQAADTTEIDVAASVAAEPPQNESRPPLLVVDDYAFFRTRWKLCLEKHGFNVHTAENGAEAIRRAASVGPLAILLDVHMPDMNGYEVCLAIKAQPQLADIPVIFVTSEGETSKKVQGFETGGVDYISKTAHESELIARVRTHVRVASLQRELKEHRNELEQQLIEIREYAAREQEMTTRIQEQQSQLLAADKMAAIGKLAAGMAHEINNPIGFVSSNLNSLVRYIADMKLVLSAYDGVVRACLQDERLAHQIEPARRMYQEKDIDFIVDDVDELLRDSIEGTERVRKIVADMRAFSHVDGPGEVEAIVNDILDRSLTVAWNELKHKAEVVKEYGDMPPVRCDGAKIGQVFLNLLINAGQAIPEHGTITLRTGYDGRVVWVEIQDTGTGISEENLPKIFDPFFTTKDVGEGTGLGLHLSLGIVHAHGGQLTASSIDGNGAIMRVELPTRDSAASEGDAT
ncbi:MAG: response regulator [Phycisphaerales bacterium]|nr:response regulator [Phycisphaerales bacterium]